MFVGQLSMLSLGPLAVFYGGAQILPSLQGEPGRAAHGVAMGSLLLQVKAARIVNCIAKKLEVCLKNKFPGLFIHLQERSRYEVLLLRVEAQEVSD